jgi:SAM-dependent methyltransferase
MKTTIWLRAHVPSHVYAILERLGRIRPSYRQFVRRQEDVAARRAVVDEQVLAIVGTETVMSGPLQGTLLNQKRSWGLDFSARLLGTYEMELHQHLERIVGNHTTRIVDVGCADGYYVVGLGRLAPSAQIVGYDIDAAALEVTSALAKLNSMSDRVQLRGLCRPKDLENQPPETLILMDCEGAEAILVTEAVAKSNPKTSFVIECHENVIPGVTDRLAHLFDGRQIDIVRQQPRSSGAAPMLPEALALEAVDELRSPKNVWLVVS